MTRTLVFIAFAGFVLAVACIAGALALGGNALANHHWGHGWVVDWDGGHGWRHRNDRTASDGATSTREIAWPGGDHIAFDVPADVQYTQSTGPAKLVITGPKDALDRLELDGGELQYSDDDWFDGSRLTIVMTAPAVRHFEISGDNKIDIAGYDQDDLTVAISGHGEVTAKGRTQSENIAISGDGDIDMSQLAAKTARAGISGSGRAYLAPTDEANVSISGSGEIDLVTHPAKVSSDVSGSGRVVQGAVAPAQPDEPATNSAAASKPS
jgi:hypothetical protein